MTKLKRGGTIEITDTIFPIKFKNGILHDGIFEECSYDKFTPYFINHKYTQIPKRIPEIHQFLDFISDNDKDWQDVLLEMMGYIFVTDLSFISSLAKFFILVGSGANGKSIISKNNWKNCG
jgi:putative DNA primase/helicase